MFKCGVCEKAYTIKQNLSRHEKSHLGARLECTNCAKTFTRRDNLARHSREIHGGFEIARNEIVINPAYTPSALVPITTTAAAVATTTSVSASPTRILPRKHRNTNAGGRKDRKKACVGLTNTADFIEINSSLRRAVVWYYRKNVENITDYRVFLSSIRSELIGKLREFTRYNPIKYNLKLESTYQRSGDIETSIENRAFKTSAREMFLDSDIGDAVDRDFATLMLEEDVYASKGSGFTLSCIDGMLLGVYEFTPLGGSSYLPLPKDIVNKRAVINPQNIDHQCFKWAILAKHTQNDNHRERVGANYRNEEHRYDFSGLSTPTPMSEIKKFERFNPGTSVNVYGLKRCKNNKKSLGHRVYPLRLADVVYPNHIDLLLIDDLEKRHYAYITNFSRLVSGQKNSREHRLFCCKRCFTSFDDQPLLYKLHGREALAEHEKICGTHKPIVPVMPEEGSTLEFDAWCRSLRIPFVIYADFEALLLKLMERYGMNTQAFQSHHPMSYGFFVKASDDVPRELLEQFEIPQTPIIFRGSESSDEVAKQFVLAVADIASRLCELLKTTNVPIIMSDEQIRLHGEKTNCDFCRKGFAASNPKVADHDHLNGRFRYTLCNTCNLKAQKRNFVPCFMHNLSRYDAHFIVTELGYDDNRITAIPNSEENFISFSKYINSDFSVRYIDTCRFMASSLSTLAANLSTDDFSKFREIAKVFSPADMRLVTRKGVYPYEYTDSWGKLEQTSLPPKPRFFSTLTETHVDDEDYEHAVEVWRHFNCQTLGEYSDLYLKIDVLLLADVFENFRDICISTYNLDPAHHYTVAGFSFDCMLKCTSIKLELLVDYDMLLMVEQGIRGGLVQASMRYARANNDKTPGYDETKEKSWIVYQDCNNLYGWAMTRYMPHGGFAWYPGNPDTALAQIERMTETDDVGMIYEVDVSYPQNLHDAHNDLPFLPFASIPPGSRVPKLMVTFEKKEKYVVHYLNLKQAIANGLIVDKVHRVLVFRQSPWISKYIDLNTEKRKGAANEFEKDFFKLMNNAVFGKTMENLRRRVKIELVACPVRMRKLINRPTFKHCTTYNDSLSAVSLHLKEIEFCKPIYIGFAVLEVSKTLMYDYHYNVMKAHYKNAISLMYTDTDSLVYHIVTDDFYNDLANNLNLLDRMDTSGLPTDHPCHVSARKKIPGLFSDETNGRTMYEFVALRAKSYAYNIENAVVIRGKGIRGHVIKNHMTFDDHKRCLFANENDDDDDDDDDDDGSSEEVEEDGRRLALQGAQTILDNIHRNAVVSVIDTSMSGASTSSAIVIPTISPSPVRPTYVNTPYRVNVSIRAFKHQLKTVKTVKLALNASDDKRVIRDGRVLTYAHGHYKTL